MSQTFTEKTILIIALAIVMASAPQGGANETESKFIDIINKTPFRGYVNGVAYQAMFGQMAVACGLRSPEWGQIYRDRLLAEVQHHIDTPSELPRPGSQDEADRAFETITRFEEQGRARVAASTSNCTFLTKPGALVGFDDKEKGTAPFWPGLIPEFARRGIIPDSLQHDR